MTSSLKRAAIGVALVTAGLAPLGANALTLVVSDAAGNIGAVDVNTGQVAHVSNLASYEGLAFDDLGNLYGVNATSVDKIDLLGGTAAPLLAHGLQNPVGMIGFPHPGGFDPLFDDIPAELQILESDGDVWQVTPDLNVFQAGSGLITAQLAFGTSDFSVGGFVWDGGWVMSVEGSFTGIAVTPGDPSFDYLTDTTVNGIGFLDQMAFDSVTAMATSALSPIVYGVSGTRIFDTATGQIISNYGGQGLGAATGAAFATENGGPEVDLPTVPLPAAIWPMLAILGVFGWWRRETA